MTKNIYQAFCPILFTASLLGVGTFKYPVSRLIGCFNFCYILCLWIAYFYIFQDFYIFSTFSSIFDSTVSLLTFYFNMFTTATSMLFSLYNSKNFGEVLKKLSLVDDTLEELGFPKIYKKIHTWMIFVVIGWVATVLFMNNIESLWTDKEVNIRYTFVIMVINHFVHTNTILDIAFIIFLLYLRSRFCKLNEYISLRCKNRRNLRLVMHKNPMTSSSNRTIVKNTTLPLEDYDVWISMHIHLELSRISNSINRLFGVQMLLEMTSIFIFLIGLIVELYTVVTTYKIWDSWKIQRVLDIVMWSTFYITKLLCVNYTCEIVSFEANRTQDIMQKVIDCLHLTIREEVLQFISEMRYKQLKISAVGFYNFGYYFIREFFGSITTFVIMLLQVESS